MPYVVRHRICISGCRLRMASIRGNQCAMTNDMSGLGQRGFESPNLVALRACRLCDLSYVLPRWLEPRTLRLFAVRLNQLSYESKRQCIDTCCRITWQSSNTSLSISAFPYLLHSYETPLERIRDSRRACQVFERLLACGDCQRRRNFPRRKRSGFPISPAEYPAAE
jgi:hypothetical protein